MDTPAALKSGVVLCKLLNAIKPGTVSKISLSEQPFHQRQNIQVFLTHAEALGVPKPELFVVEELFEGRNLMHVYSCILSLSNVCRKVCGAQRRRAVAPLGAGGCRRGMSARCEAQLYCQPLTARTSGRVAPPSCTTRLN